MNPFQKTLVHAVACLLILTIAMVLFLALGYIDLSVVTAIYLPLAVVVLAAVLVRQHLFAYILAGSAVVGLGAEYIVHLVRENPGMAGAFLGTAILLLGAIAGIIAQIIRNISAARKKSKDS
ncbi:MAG: hypothetical protein R6W96_01810 [Clostridia bacterium]